MTKGRQNMDLPSFCVCNTFVTLMLIKYIVDYVCSVGTEQD